ncbi:MAG: thioredoxin domain-containing protein [Flavobacteriaceae bacterium]|nr:thioredoxin domain-containing protein [Flavobacteriaceae bacterium]|tara:strand:+ start:2331 stop:4442 length:2112 start_codon:yes stop_codon:yes gene_type:complete
MKIIALKIMKDKHLVFLIFLSMFYSNNITGQNMENKLSNETSLYLKQHATNPVNWVPWGNQALEIAKKNDKLLLISIGYSSCHWCHVMEEESFENKDVAEVMNSKYINIKVDREERPDIDEIYMKALVLMTGSGGWPMNIIALPDGTPIWGGTYVPKDQWIQVLNQVEGFYKTRKEDVLEYAKNVKDGVKKESLIKPITKETKYTSDFQNKLVTKAFNFTDKVNGGIAVGQKFPLPSFINFFLRYSKLNGNKEMESFVKNTLTKISQGGINDRLEGGFHRYTVDNKWHIPHFEKMLYDNAQLLSVFSKAFMAFDEPRFKEEIYNIYDFLELKMTSNDGLIFSSISADTNYQDGTKQEGDFYIWTQKELKEILKKDFNWVSKYYNINEKGYWERDNYVFYQTISDEKFASDMGMTTTEFKNNLKGINKKLFNYREKRIQPIIDTKIIFSWNALTIRGLIDAYKATGDNRFLEKAIEINKTLEEKMIKGNKIAHTNGQILKNQVLFFEDYSYYIDALIGLYEATYEIDWIEKAVAFTEFCNVEFQQEDYFYKFSSNQDLLYSDTLVQLEDGVTPSANSIMNFNLFRLSHYLGNKDFSNYADKMINNIIANLENRVTDHMFWLWSSLNYSESFFELAISGPDAKQKAKELSLKYLPNAVIAAYNEPSDLYLLKDRFVKDVTYIYVCVNNTCKFPVTNIKEALKLMD